MANTFGRLPGDGVTNSFGDVMPNVSLELYASEADATAQANSLGSVNTDGYGSWSFDVDPTVNTLWVRDPGGGIHPTLPQSLSDAVAANATALAGKADKSAVAAIAPDGGAQAVGKGELILNVKDFGAMGDGATDDTAAIQSALNAAAPFGVTVTLNGDHVVNGQLTIPSGLRMDGSRGTLRQTASLWSLMRLTGVTGVRLRNITALGKTTDWVGSSAVLGATGVYVTGGSSDVVIESCTFTGFAGSSVFIYSGSSDIHIRGCRMVGPGPAYLTDTTKNYGGGVTIQSDVENWSVESCDISASAQGVSTGDGQTNARIRGNYIHDIPSQHGLYLSSVDGVVVVGNVIRNTGLLGMKIQISSSVGPDPSSVVISNNTFINVGDAGILLTNPSGGGRTIRNVALVGNVVNGCGADGITVNNSAGVLISGNVLAGCGRHGISLTDSSELTVADNRVDGCASNGVVLTGCTGFAITNVRVRNPAKADIAASEFGIQISTGCSDGTVTGCKVTDDSGHMRYGIYINSTADMTTLGFIDNTVSGATDYGYRGLAANARTFRGNSFSGATGAMLTPPTNFVQIADLTTAPTAADINGILAILRSNGQIRI